MSEDYSIPRNCPECGTYDRRYYCDQCKTDLCYECHCKYHRDHKLYGHSSIWFLNNGPISIVDNREVKD